MPPLLDALALVGPLCRGSVTQGYALHPAHERTPFAVVDQLRQCLAVNSGYQGHAALGNSTGCPDLVKSGKGGAM